MVVEVRRRDSVNVLDVKLLELANSWGGEMENRKKQLFALFEPLTESTICLQT